MSLRQISIFLCLAIVLCVHPAVGEERPAEREAVPLSTETLRAKRQQIATEVARLTESKKQSAEDESASESALILE